MPLTLRWLCRQPTPYNDFLFRSLARQPDINLRVEYLASRLSSHPWYTRLATGYPVRWLPHRAYLDVSYLVQAVRDPKTFFVIGGWGEPVFWVLASLLIAVRRPFAIWTDTPDPFASRKPLKAALRRSWLQWALPKIPLLMATGWPAAQGLERMGCPPDHLLNFPYFIDLDVFQPPAALEAGSPLNLFSCGRLDRQKGYDLALEALACLRDELRPELDSGCLWKIAGDGPEKENLIRQAHKLGLSGCVDFLGWIEPGRLPEQFAAAPLFLHPARFEPYGVAVLEAMASGSVVVASDATAAALDRIVPGQNGFLHRREDVRHLARILQEILSNPDRLQPVRQAARLAAESWPVERGIAALRQAVQRLVSR